MLCYMCMYYKETLNKMHMPKGSQIIKNCVEGGSKRTIV